MNIDQKLQIAKQTRKIAADSLLEILKIVLNSSDQISEVEFADRWLLELKKNSEIFYSGWYDPPPLGIAVLFGGKNNLQRVNMDTLRNEKYWPKATNYLDKEGIGYFYFSPANKETEIIGDFGINIYFGEDSNIINLLKTILEIDKQIFEFIQVGMEFREIADFAEKVLEENNLSSNIVSATDPVGINIGHTIPGISEDWTEEELEILKEGDKGWYKFRDIISKKRIFINKIESYKVSPGMAFTIEPRPIDLNNPDLPMVSFHTLVLINSKGEKEFFTGFEEIFKLVGMDYL